MIWPLTTQVPSFVSGGADEKVRLQVEVLNLQSIVRHMDKRISNLEREISEMQQTQQED